MEKTKNNVFETKIAGVNFKLRTSHSKEVVDELVNFVNSKFKEAMESTKGGSANKAVILAALNIAEDYTMLKKKANLELNRLLVETQKISSDLELIQCSQTKQRMEVNEQETVEMDPVNTTNQEPMEATL